MSITIEKDVLKDVVTMLRQNVIPVESMENNEFVLSYSLDDLEVRFRRAEKTTFDRLVFKAFERYFLVKPDLTLVMFDEDESVLDVSNPTLISSMSAYLRWRLTIFAQLGV